MTTTEFGNKTRSLRINKVNANLTALRTFYYDVLLLTTAYSACEVHFFLGHFPNMELMLLLLSPLFLTDLLYFPVGRLIYNSVFDRMPMRA